jgi:hypothetical protein
MPNRFVWIKNLGKIYPQKWPDGGTSSASHDYYKTHVTGEVIADRVITNEEFKLSIDELAAKYPAPTVVGEVFPPEMPLPKPLMPRSTDA